MASTLGTLPGGSTVSVQTAIAGQVNLVNTAGLTLSFWDGDAGPKNDGAVNGGNGVWRDGRRHQQLDRARSGTPNADYAQDSFAIFSAAPGTVTVDNVGGNVLASGMQFASDGYVDNRRRADADRRAGDHTGRRRQRGKRRLHRDDRRRTHRHGGAGQDRRRHARADGHEQLHRRHGDQRRHVCVSLPTPISATPRAGSASTAARSTRRRTLPPAAP